MSTFKSIIPAQGINVAAEFGCLYLHGFLSSPQSIKAQQVRDYYDQQGWKTQLTVPALPFSPQAAMALAEVELQRLLERFGKAYIIGSSLGGYYATYLSEMYQVPAVLVNPAVRPFELFERYLGVNEHIYSDQVDELTPEHIEQLKALYCPRLRSPEKLFLLLQTGDETLDYRQAAEYYRESPSWLEAGGNHSFVGFEARLPSIIAFARQLLVS